MYNIPSFLLRGTFQITRRGDLSRQKSLAKMWAKRSEFGQAEVAVIFEAEYQRRGRYTEKEMLSPLES